MVDKDYCCSSYLAFRFIERDGVDFFEGLHHPDTVAEPQDALTRIGGARELDEYLTRDTEEIKKKYQKLGIMLSGGMDSACIASYFPGADAYTFRFLGGDYAKDELERAESYAKHYGLKLHYVDITWRDVEDALPIILDKRMEPGHSLEPQIYKLCMQAKKDGVDYLVSGDSADTRFGGLDRMLIKDWEYDDFVKWFPYVNPVEVLRKPVDVNYVFEKFRRGDRNKIDSVRVMRELHAPESEKSQNNVFALTNVQHIAPYSRYTTELDLDRIRSGDTKYVIRELFRMKYPGLAVPEKRPMPRPVDFYFADWSGPVRKEFLPELDMKKFRGDQKWMLWCLEFFLNRYDPE